MSLEIQQREREGIVIFQCHGRLISGEESELFHKEIKATLEAGKPNIILDLEKVDYIDSTGLGELVACYSAAQEKQGAMKLMKLNDRNMELLVITKLTTLFELFNDEQDAVNSFFPDRAIPSFDLLAFVKEKKEEK